MRKIVMAFAAVSVLLTIPAAARADNLFDLAKSESGFSQFPFWAQVLKDMASAQSSEAAVIPAGLDGTPPDVACADERHCSPAEWTTFLETLRDKPRRDQIEAVNRWANQKPYVEDLANWGVADYWETPGEFLARGGDCEDFAITKYFSLVRLGVPTDDLRLAVVKDASLGAFHAVLVVRDQGQAWLLDNQIADVVPFSDVPQYQTIYALNDRNWWMPSPPLLQLGSVMIVAAGPTTPLGDGAKSR